MIALSELIRSGLGPAACRQNTAEFPGRVHASPLRGRVEMRAAPTRRWSWLLLAVTAAACSESSGPGTTAAELKVGVGTLAVSVAENEEFDPNGYTLSVDGAAPEFVPAVFPSYERIVRVGGLRPGAHSMRVSGVAAHCAASPSSPIAFTTSAGAVTQIGIAIVCATAARSRAVPDAR